MSNAYAQLPDFSADSPVHIKTTRPHDDNLTNVTPDSISDVTNVTRNPNKPKLGANKMHSRFKQKAIARFLNREIKRDEHAHENALIEEYIDWTEDKRTALAKWNTEAPKCAAIEQAHEGYPTKRATVLQQSKNFRYNLRARAKRAVQKLVDK